MWNLEICSLRCLHRGYISVSQDKRTKIQQKQKKQKDKKTNDKMTKRQKDKKTKRQRDKKTKKGKRQMTKRQTKLKKDKMFPFRCLHRGYISLTTEELYLSLKRFSETKRQKDIQMFAHTGYISVSKQMFMKPLALGGWLGPPFSTKS